jgi:hypothetical protein
MSWAEEQLAMLKPKYAGRWDVWIIYNYPTGVTWCARPVGHPVATINTDSPEHMVEEIAEQERAAL